MTGEDAQREMTGGAVAVVEERESERLQENRAPANWTVLAYLAGDNDLEGAAIEDINEMEQVGSRQGAVEIVVQVDRVADYDQSNDDWRSTRRYHITQGADPRRITSPLLADLGETNTGDPRALEEFIAFGASRFQARSYALILWNHGSGFYVPPELLPGRARRRGASFHAPPPAEPLFHHARAAAPARSRGAGDRLRRRVQRLPG